MNNRLRNVAVVVVLAVVFGGSLSGCATPASSSAMTVTAGDYRQSKGSANNRFEVRNVSGGQETNPLWTSQVSSDGFREALVSSLSAHGFSSENGAKVCAVDAELQALSQPLFGFDMSVTSTVRYTVTAGNERKLYPVTATGTAKVSDAFIGVERLKIANERSIRENIKEFLKLLSSDWN